MNSTLDKKQLRSNSLLFSLLALEFGLDINHVVSDKIWTLVIRMDIRNSATEPLANCSRSFGPPYFLAALLTLLLSVLQFASPQIVNLLINFVQVLSIALIQCSPLARAYFGHRLIYQKKIAWNWFEDLPNLIIFKLRNARNVCFTFSYSLKCVRSYIIGRKWGLH